MIKSFLSGSFFFVYSSQVTMDFFVFVSAQMVEDMENGTLSFDSIFNVEQKPN